jgi:hypothetical protein
MAAWTSSGVRTLPGCGRLRSVLRPAPLGLDAEDDGQPLSTGAAGPELDPGHDGDGHQQPTDATKGSIFERQPGTVAYIVPAAAGICT